MKLNVLKSTAVIIVALLFIVSGTASCKKDKTCYGTVKVTDIAGTPLSGANVLLHAPSVSGQVTYEAATDANGEAYFEIKLPAIFDIEATHPSLPGKKGTGTLRCDEPGKKTSTTVKIV